MPEFAAARERMIERHIVRRGIGDPRIIQALRDVPRELFVPHADRACAYDDGPLPIGAGQTISQPYIVALMIDAAGIRPGDHVLEVGAGSGYAAAVIGRIAGSVVAVERHADLAEGAAARLARLGMGHVRILHGDGTADLPVTGPFDAIIVSAAGTEIPGALARRLRPGGAMVIPVGLPDEVQQLVRLTRGADGGFAREELGAVRFVPLITDTGGQG